MWHKSRAQDCWSCWRISWELQDTGFIEGALILLTSWNVKLTPSGSASVHKEKKQVDCTPLQATIRSITNQHSHQFSCGSDGLAQPALSKWCKVHNIQCSVWDCGLMVGCCQCLPWVYPAPQASLHAAVTTPHPLLFLHLLTAPSWPVLWVMWQLHDCSYMFSSQDLCRTDGSRIDLRAFARAKDRRRQEITHVGVWNMLGR